MKRKEFSNEEIMWIKENYYKYGTKYLAEAMNIPYNTVRRWITSLKFDSRQGQSKGKKWNDSEIKLLIDNYPTKGGIYCSKILKRSTASINWKAKSLSVYRENWKWSNEEVTILTEHVKCFRDINKVTKLLPSRSISAIWHKCIEIGIYVTQPDRKGSIKREKIPAEISNEVYKKYDARCGKCNKPKSEVTLEIHHIIPYRTCNVHEIDNLLLLCTDCHKNIHEEKKQGKIKKLAPLLEIAV